MYLLYCAAAADLLPRAFVCSDVTRPTFAALVRDALARVNSESFAAAQCAADEDSDSWLDVDQEDVDAIIQSRRSNFPGAAAAVSNDLPSREGEAMVVDSQNAESAAIEGQTAKLRNLAGKVEKFIESRGDLEGARFDE